MSLRESNIFGRKEFRISGDELETVVGPASQDRPDRDILYFGYAKLAEDIKQKYRIKEIDADVDGFFRLDKRYEFESYPVVLTVGIRGSRFAQVVFWEIFHILAVGGIWIDIDYSYNCQGTPLIGKDFLDRDYYVSSLVCCGIHRQGNYLLKYYRKEVPSLISDQICEGWSFGILTAGQSEHAEIMVRNILALNHKKMEIIVCGAKPRNIPNDKRVRHIDLEYPEPRGWISRKKNIIADAARYGNLCIMHDRFIFPRNFFEAMEQYGRVFSFLTFPQFFFPDSTRTFFQRYPDYQVLLQERNLEETVRHKIYNGERIFHPSYNDYYETAFCCGGVYVTKKTLWNLIKQDESLFHCEWEDVVFGLESQQKGIPHRVNPFALFESVNGHSLLLTGMHVCTPARKMRSFSTISDTQKRVASRLPSAFKPVIGRERMDYYRNVAGKYNSIKVVGEEFRIGEKDYTQCRKLSDFWQLVYAHIRILPVTCRDDLREIYSLLSAFIYNYPNCILQTWIRSTEMELLGRREASPPSLGGRFLRSIGWHLYRCLKQVILKYNNISYDTHGPEYGPFIDLIAYLKKMEKHYPILFIDNADDNGPAALDTQEKERLFRAFLQSDIAETAFVVEHQGVVLPPLGVHL